MTCNKRMRVGISIQAVDVDLIIVYDRINATDTIPISSTIANNTIIKE